MPRTTNLRIRNYRSIGSDGIELKFPSDLPLVLIGENNAGKSNIVKAIELVLGDTWPGSFQPEDHDFFNRDVNNVPIEITVDVSGVTSEYRGIDRAVEYLVLRWSEHSSQSFWMKVAEELDESRYISNDVRDQCHCTVVAADRRLQYQLSYSSKYTLLSRLMREFHKALSNDQDRMQSLRDQFETTRRIFEDVPEFHDFSIALRDKLAELSGTMTYGLSVDFSAYDPSNYFHALRILPVEGEAVRTFEELGTGQEQVLALAFAHAYARAFHGSLLLAIEEPEAHLHPLAQQWVSRVLAELAHDGVQIVVTTHSPTFVNVLSLEGIVLVRKWEGETVVVQLSRNDLVTHCRATGAAQAREDNILGFYSAAATHEILAGLFARKIILVEGATEALTLPIYLERVGLTTERSGIAAIPVFGVGNLAKWWRFFTAYEIPTYVVFDNDNSEDGDRRRRRDLLTALNFPADEHEGIMAATDPLCAKTVAVMGGSFETTLRQLFGDAYTDLEREAEQLLGGSSRGSKPLVARYVAERIEFDQAHPAWAFFSCVKEYLEELS